MLRLKWQVKPLIYVIVQTRYTGVKRVVRLCRASIALSETPDGTHNGGTKLQSSSVSLTAQSTSAMTYPIYLLTINSEITEPTIIYYYCENHPNMGGQINITPCVPTPTPTETPIAQQDPTPTPTPTQTPTPSSGAENTIIETIGGFDIKVSDDFSKIITYSYGNNGNILRFNDDTKNYETNESLPLDIPTTSTQRTGVLDSYNYGTPSTSWTSSIKYMLCF